MGEDTRNDATNAGVRPVMVGLAAVVALLIGVGATLLVSALRSAPATPTQSGELLVVSADTAQMDMTAGQAYLSLIGVDPQTLFHESPMLVPAVPQIPRVGGPTPSVYVGGLPGAKIGDKLVVVGPPSSISKAPQSTPPDVAPSD